MLGFQRFLKQGVFFEIQFRSYQVVGNALVTGYSIQFRSVSLANLLNRKRLERRNLYGHESFSSRSSCSVPAAGLCESRFRPVPDSRKRGKRSDLLPSKVYSLILPR